MIYATAEDGTKITPGFSGQRAICPGCGNEVVARCGRIVIWHWSHLSGVDCDPWSEPLSLWHLRWQKYLASLGAQIEVVIEKNGEKHRADAVLRNGAVVELQHSTISVDKIEERESFYGEMLWVFDAVSAYQKNRFLLRPNDNYYTFRWKHARKSVAYAQMPVRLDLGDGKVLDVKKISKETPCGGWGKLKIVSEVAFDNT